MTAVWEGSLLPGGTAAPPGGPHDALLKAACIALLIVWLLVMRVWG